MPRVNWGVSARDIDNFDRDSQYKPYDGPIPANGVYEWQIKVLKSIAPTDDKLPQLRVGLELAPRDGNKAEQKYAGYFTMAFLSISDKMMWKLVPFLDAIGVTGRDFEARTITDEEGNIKKIGTWRNTGDEYIKAELKDGQDQAGNSRKEIGWMGPITDNEDEEDYDDDESDDDGGWDDE